ncbi:hypothetical protein Bcp1_194 [Bacillus phage Bcp1]|uniref:Uncharacterized protein n=1 Tax=Bacillus phage Bcp1 TaxID=584892 RepID=X2JJ03_9CAUD|nr:hypothetical protein Bcp1_194 [Bacillus phage Bcp1]AHN66669.1 hypothetical protein Bcp1_194 [Bacillus phage Bcp1]
MDEKKEVIVGRCASLGWSDLHLDDVILVVWDSAEALKPVQQSFSMESMIQYTTVEMEEIKEKAEKRAQDQFKKMLSKPRRKR